MTPQGIMRALVAGLLALIVSATALVARPDAGAASGGESAAELQSRAAALVPSLPRMAVVLPDPADDALPPADIDHVVQCCLPTPVHAAVPVTRLNARRSTCPARGPPGSAP